MSHTPGPSTNPNGWDDETEYHLPEHHAPLPELSHAEPAHAEPSTADFLAVSRSDDYRTLRSSFRNFAFPMTIAGLVSFFVYVLLSIYAVDLMARPLLGSLSVGMTLGLLQFAVVYVWTALYVNYANKRLDPISSKLKAQLENGVKA